MPRAFLAAKGQHPHTGAADLSVGYLEPLQHPCGGFLAPDLHPRRWGEALFGPEMGKGVGSRPLRRREDNFWDSFQDGKSHHNTFSMTGHFYGVVERCPPLTTNPLQDQRSTLPGHPWDGLMGQEGMCPQRHLPFGLVTAMTMMGTPMREESTQMQTLMILALAGVRKSSALTGWHTAM